MSHSIEFREDGLSKWVRVGFYVHKGEVLGVREDDRVREEPLMIPAGQDKHDESKTIFPSAYDLPRPEGNLSVARFYYDNVEYRNGNFYLDGKPLDAIARPVRAAITTGEEA